MSTQTAAGRPAEYPLRFDVEYPATLNRWLPLVKWLLVIPQLLIVNALGTVAGVIQFIAFFAVLFTEQYPRSLFDFVVNINRWSENVYAYVFLMRDEYPPFAWDAGVYPVTYEVDYPERLSRWLPLVKWLLAIPHYVVLAVLYLIAVVLIAVAFFAILFTTQFPRGMFDFVAGTIRWNLRVNAYVLFMRDEYPPFSLK